MTRKTTWIAALLCALLLAGCDDDDGGFFPGSQNRTYDVTIENLTDSQPLSPGVIVTHTSAASVWTMGAAASEGVRLIAENGDPATAMSMLTGAAGVDQVVVIDAPIHRIGGPGATSATYRIGAGPDVGYLSIASMLICTNDGFTGLDSMQLSLGFDPVVVTVMAYDAGTETNDELFASIPDPCQAAGPVQSPADGNARTAEGGTIQAHPGIQGGGDLDPAAHGWMEPVARITITRVS